MPATCEYPNWEQRRLQAKARMILQLLSAIRCEEKESDSLHPRFYVWFFASRFFVSWVLCVLGSVCPGSSRPRSNVSRILCIPWLTSLPAHSQVEPTNSWNHGQTMYLLVTTKRVCNISDYKGFIGWNNKINENDSQEAYWHIGPGTHRNWYA